MFSDKEARNYLCWVLVDRAAEFHTLILRHNETIAYCQVIYKMEDRFGFRHLPETAQMNFNQATQKKGEKKNNGQREFYN